MCVQNTSQNGQEKKKKKCCTFCVYCMHMAQNCIEWLIKWLIFHEQPVTPTGFLNSVCFRLMCIIKCVNRLGQSNHMLMLALDTTKWPICFMSGCPVNSCTGWLFWMLPNMVYESTLQLKREFLAWVHPVDSVESSSLEIQSASPWRFLSTLFFFCCCFWLQSHFTNQNQLVQIGGKPMLTKLLQSINH